jgi:hypothetical protein
LAAKRTLGDKNLTLWNVHSFLTHARDKPANTEWEHGKQRAFDLLFAKGSEKGALRESAIREMMTASHAPLRQIENESVKTKKEQERMKNDVKREVQRTMDAIDDASAIVFPINGNVETDSVASVTDEEEEEDRQIDASVTIDASKDKDDYNEDEFMTLDSLVLYSAEAATSESMRDVVEDVASWSDW